MGKLAWRKWRQLNFLYPMYSACQINQGSLYPQLLKWHCRYLYSLHIWFFRTLHSISYTVWAKKVTLLYCTHNIVKYVKLVFDEVMCRVLKNFFSNPPCMHTNKHSDRSLRLWHQWVKMLMERRKNSNDKDDVIPVDCAVMLWNTDGVAEAGAVSRASIANICFSDPPRGLRTYH